MATPQVAGAAAFLFTKFPTATVAQIKDKILRSVDKKPSLNGDVATGGRLNLYKAAAESTAAVSGGVLTFTAGAGQKNNVTATRFTDTDSIAKYRITDPYSTSTTAQQSGSRINPGAGCTRVNDTTVKCPVAGITRIVLNGGDQNDSLNAGTIAIPVTLNGGRRPGRPHRRHGRRLADRRHRRRRLHCRHRQRHDQRPQRGRRHELQLRRERRRQRHRERRPLPERPDHRQRHQLRGGQQAVVRGAPLRLSCGSASAGRRAARGSASGGSASASRARGPRR